MKASMNSRIKISLIFVKLPPQIPFKALPLFSNQPSFFSKAIPEVLAAFSLLFLQIEHLILINRIRDMEKNLKLMASQESAKMKRFTIPG
jgi:hypothetical protein